MKKIVSPVAKPTFFERTLVFRTILVLVILSFGILTILARQYHYFKIDLIFTLAIQQYKSFWFDSLMRVVTLIGDPISVVLLVVFLSGAGFLLERRRAPLILMASTLGGLLLSEIIKILVGRPRPDPTLVHQIGYFLKADSFPSGHVLGAVSLYGFLLYISFTKLKKSFWRIGIMVICILMIILMGLSRIYLGAHWFSDVLGAYLVGFIWLSFVILIYQRLNK